LLRWILFKLDAETAHHVTFALIRLGIRLGNAPLRIASGRLLAPASPVPPTPRVFGLEFRSRLGLAAGFDKNAEILAGLPALGFGFAEIGTVTPRPQPGNDRPRLFRRIPDRAIFNRMGFNGLGAALVSARLTEVRPLLPAGFRVGVNVGKNKDTSAEDAHRDYRTAVSAFAGLCDYVVINVSSPNTPGLRALQALDSLKPIVLAVREAVSGWSTPVPVLLKVAPELFDVAVEPVTRPEDLIPAAEEWGVQGWVLTNTLAGSRQIGTTALPGGWSGSLLTAPSRDALIRARSLTRLPIISVGGIMDAREASERLRLGADLLQVYSGWIYGGPGWPSGISREIAGK
jgi:dihydroorotate dehydrogenase